MTIHWTRVSPWERDDPPTNHSTAVLCLDQKQLSIPCLDQSESSCMMFRGIFCPLYPQTAGRSGVEESFEQLGQSMMEWYFVNIVDDNPKNIIFLHQKTLYRVSHNWVLTLFCLFSQLPELVQTFILPFYNSPGDVDSKTHLTFHPMSKIYQVTK